MCRWIFLCFVFFISFSFRAHAAVFVVTSKADSGPGTLREALTKAAANGTAEKDYINFNLPGASEAARTITLLSELPYLSSNIIVDGSSQPGNKISPGDTKVIINTDANSYYYAANTSGFTIKDLNDVAIYGLSMNQFDGSIIVSESLVASAIVIRNSTNIIIGAPGKGNMFSADEFAIFNGVVSGTNDTPSSDIKVQSNIFGPDYFGAVALYADNVLFGGDGPLEGNHISEGLIVSGSNLQVIHNYFGIDVNGKLMDGSPKLYCGNGSNIEIRDNFSNNIEIGVGPASKFKILGNHDDIGAKNNQGVGIQILESSDGIIGSEDIIGQNVFHGGNPVEFWVSRSKNIQILKNSINCSAAPYYVDDPVVGVIIPDIKVLINNDTEYSGYASPGSVVYIYEDNTDCPICNPVVFYAEVTANAAGKWKITGNFKDKKMISNALLNKNSSQFTNVSIQSLSSNSAITQPTCGKNNGSIEIFEVYNAVVIDWYNVNNEKVGEGTKLDKVGAGTYYAVARNGNCSVRTDFIALYNTNPKIYDDAITVTNPSCGKGGSITGLTPVFNSQNPITYTWTDKQNKIVGDQTDITDLAAGEYTFTMHDEIAGCELSYGPVILKNASGPTVDQSVESVQSSNCGQSTGSITNIKVTGTGTLKYVWWDSNQQQVGSAKDLTNQPAGVYKLQVTDDTQCGPIYTTDITIPETNGIILDESKAIKTIASCGQNNGTVTGITASGATKYQWTDASGKLVSTTADLTGVPSGDYTLIASSNFGCSKTSQVYHVDLQAVTQFPQYAASTVPSCDQLSNGSVTVTTDALVKSARWVNSNGGPAGNQTALTDVAAGTYKLYLTDQNGCEQLYNTYTIDELPEFKTADRGQITNDQCGLKTGSVSNVTIAGGALPYTYKWTDASNNIVGTNNSIDKLAAGNYTLQVVDMRCSEVDIPYTITEESAEVAAPSARDVQLCSSGSALITVINPSATITYRLYESASSVNPTAEQEGGRFTVTVSGNRSYFISQLSGTCESSRGEAKVTVGLSSADIANAFTPNADGINDYWNISNIESYPDALVQIFTRYGQKVFESRGYARPFDGTMSGKKLPAGVYYYIINLNTECNVLSGSLTIIR